MKPILIVTCKAGNEEWCENEIGNILYLEDPSITVSRTRYPGLLIVYAEGIDGEHAYRVASRYEYGFVKNIIPVNYYTDNIDELLRYISEHIPHTGRVKLKLKVRGRRGLSRNLWERITGILRSRGVIHDPKARSILHIEVINGYFYVGFKREG